MPRNDAPAARPTVVGETPLALLRRARRTNRALAVAHPDAHCELDFTTPLELLVATVLSAQTTDVRVNQVTPALFAAYPNAAHYAAADVEDIEQIIRPTGFFRAKAKSTSSPSTSASKASMNGARQVEDPQVPNRPTHSIALFDIFSPTDQNQKRLYQGFQPLAFLYRRSL